MNILTFNPTFEEEKFIDEQIEKGFASNKTEVLLKALELFISTSPDKK